MAWYHRVLNIFRSDRVSREIEREMAFHLAERVDELKESGLSEKEARRLARRQFGNETALEERTRDVDIAAWLQSAVGDLRYALRALRRSPVFTVVAVTSLSLGIGANTTIFTLIDTLVLRPLPVLHPEQLVQVTPDAVDPDRASDGGYFTNPLWEQVRDRQDVFSAVTAFGQGVFNLNDGSVARRISGGTVSGDYFATFGVRPAVGRLFTSADDVRGCPGVAVLSHRFWERAYGGARAAIGRTITLTGHPFEIIGVAAKEFRGSDVGREDDVYVPLCTETITTGDPLALEARSQWYLRIIGRLKPGVDVRQASTRLAVIAPASYAETVPPHWSADSKKEYANRTLSARPAARGLSDMRARYRTALFALMAGVALVLMIACANVANLLLSRAEARQHELAIRLAIGAARVRLMRQMLTESMVLAIAGAAAGVLLARWGAQGLVGMLGVGDTNVVSLDLALNKNILAFTVALATLTVIVFGLVPAWRATRVSAQAAMKAQGRGLVEGQSRVTIGKMLVAAQVALSLVLVVGATLFVGTLRNLSRLDPGFSSEGVLLVQLDLGRPGLGDEGIGATRRAIVDRTRALPGVTSASTAEFTPAGGSTWNDEIVVNDFRPKSGEDALSWFNEVSPGFFETMQTRLLSGRDFNSGDVRSDVRAAVVNDAFARRFFGDANPLGRQFRTKVGDTTSGPRMIVGLVENAKYRSLRDDAEPVAYLAAAQSEGWSPRTTLIVRTRGDPTAMIPAVTRAMQEIASGVTLHFTTLERQLSDSLQRERLLATLSGLFGVLALLLAALGLYGTMAYAVARRRSELGVRIALGATRRRVVSMVLREVAIVLLIGVAVGGVASVVSTRLVTSFLYDLQATEPAVYLLATLLLSAAAFCAGLVPAWRAATVDPIRALREE